MTNDNPTTSGLASVPPRPDGADKVTGRAAYAADTTMPGMIWGQGAAQPPSARPHQVDRHLEGREAAGRHGGDDGQGHRRFPDRQGPGDAGHPGHALDVPQRHGAREGAVPRPPGRRRRRRFPGGRRRSPEADQGRLRGPALGDQRQGRDEAGAAPLHDHVKFDGKPSNIAGTLEHKKGDVEAGFKEADVIVERSFDTEARCTRACIEPHALPWSASSTARPRSGAPARASSWSAPCRAADEAFSRATSAPSPPRSAAASAARPSSISNRWRWFWPRSRAGRSRW